MGDEVSQCTLKMGLTEDQEAVETFPAHGADEPLGESVGPRGSDRRLGDPDALGSEHLVEAGGEFGVTVSNQELGQGIPVRQDEGEVPCLLGDPLPRRAGGDPAQMHSAGVELDEEQHVEAAEEHRVDGEDVTGQEAGAWAFKNSDQVGPVRCGAGSIPCRRRIAQTLEGAIRTPICASSPWIRR